ncbi:helix-turn-helix domain-containing protein [Eikenella longinqua]|nr:helix-turn-helix transcriptional regulator [Eikenella longinqua]
MSDENAMMEEVADRLISERVRLGYSKADFAREIDITRNTLRTYEIAKSNIPSNILVRMGSLGVDVMYVLFNQRNPAQAESLAEQTRREGERLAEQMISGNTMSNSVIAGNGSTINNINTTKHVSKTVAEVKPGKGHITDEQASTIQKLVDDIVVIESSVKQKPRGHKAVWTAFNRRMKIPSYRLLRLEQFDDACNYLRSTVGRLMKQKNARKKLPGDEWRNRKYRYIHASFKEIPELETWFKRHIKAKFKVDSKADLSDDELEQAYTSLSNKKRELAKRK